VVDFGHDVARPLCSDVFEPLVSLHLDSAGLVGKVDGQLELRAEAYRLAKPAQPLLRFRARR
jgi:hypothetical protein